MGDYLRASRYLATNGNEWTVDPLTAYYKIDPATGIQDTSKANGDVRVFVGDYEAYYERREYKSLAPYYYGSTIYYGDSKAGTSIPAGSPTGSELGDKVIFSQNIRSGSDYQAVT